MICTYGRLSSIRRRDDRPFIAMAVAGTRERSCHGIVVVLGVVRLPSVQLEGFVAIEHSARGDSWLSIALLVSSSGGDSLGGGRNRGNASVIGDGIDIGRVCCGECAASISLSYVLSSSTRSHHTLSRLPRQEQYDSGSP